MRGPGSPRTWIVVVTAVLVSCAAGAATFSFFASREAPRKKDLAVAFSQLRDDVGALSRVARPDAPRLMDDPDDRPREAKNEHVPATVEDLNKELARTRLTIAGLVREMVASREAANETDGTERDFIFSRSGQTAEWKALPGMACRSLCVTNEGSSLADDVRVLIDGKTLPATSGEFIARVVDPSMNEKQKAVALWRAVVEGRRHDWPAHPEAKDPVKLLGVYGYGFCSHAAQALAEFAQEVGLNSRVRQARGQHVVAEIMVDGRWAVFDADGEAYYIKPDGVLASADDLRQDPGLLALSPSTIYAEAKLQDFYMSAELREKKPSSGSEPHSLQVALRPGESIRYSRARQGLFFSSRYLEEPREYANGEWTFEPRPQDQLWLLGCESSANLQAVPETEGPWSWSTGQPGSPAKITYAFELPYPALDGDIEVAAEGGQPMAEFSRDGTVWQEIPGQPSGAGRWTFPLSSHLRRVSGAPDYRFEVRLAFPPAATPIRIGRLRYRFDLQMAPRHLPLPSQDEGSLGVHYTSEGPAEIRVQTVCVQTTP